MPVMLHEAESWPDSAQMSKPINSIGMSVYDILTRVNRWDKCTVLQFLPQSPGISLYTLEQFTAVVYGECFLVKSVQKLLELVKFQ